jgi:cytochrome c peroxidase/Tol biopolymer transport system component
VLIAFILFGSCEKNLKRKYFSPDIVSYSPNGEILAFTDLTKEKVYIASEGEIEKEFSTGGKPSDLEWINNKELIILIEDKAEARILSLERGGMVRSFSICPHPSSVKYFEIADELWITSSGLDSVYIYDLNSTEELASIPAGRNPVNSDISPDGRLVAVSCLLPERAFQSENVASAITIIDRERKNPVKTIVLPYGSSNLRNAVFSRDGKKIYAVHTRGRVNLPTSQLEKGWVNTNMMSIIDVESLQLSLSILLDKLSEGAANPWNITISQDDKRAYITISGTHELAVVDLEKLKSLLDGKDFPSSYMDNHAGAETSADVWRSIEENPETRWLLSENMAALYSSGILKRISLSLNGPRGISLSPDGSAITVAGYFSGNLIEMNSDDFRIRKEIKAGKQPPADAVRQGEIIFHDATQCFQHWLSCITCHPKGRADGLNWDLLNDGIGNPKNTKSLLLTHETPPVMSRGVRPDYKAAVTKGFHFIQFYESDENENLFIQKYLESMEPLESPYKQAYNKEKIKLGEEIFHSSETGCAVCHPGPLFTDLRMYDVGTSIAPDRFDDFDTPSLVEVWRSGPYLHNGIAKSMLEVLTLYNENDLHGVTSHLSVDELDALSLYVLSL